jgi:hypothetical protein
LIWQFKRLFTMEIPGPIEATKSSKMSVKLGVVSSGKTIFVQSLLTLYGPLR